MHHMMLSPSTSTANVKPGLLPSAVDMNMLKRVFSIEPPVTDVRLREEPVRVSIAPTDAPVDATIPFALLFRTMRTCLGAQQALNILRQHGDRVSNDDWSDIASSIVADDTCVQQVHRASL
jgi:hypothetical protein